MWLRYSGGVGVHFIPSGSRPKSVGIPLCTRNRSGTCQDGMFGMKDTRKWKRLRNDVAEIKRGCWGSFDPLGVQSKSAGDATIFPKLVRDMSG